MRTIRHKFTYQHPPEIVWDYLTNAELLSQWLMPNDIKPVVGHEFMFKTKPMVKLGFDGNVYCEVLEAVPCKKLVYSWRGGMSKEKPMLNSVVTWTLHAIPGGTELQLEHKGFEGMKNFIAYMAMNMGWTKIGKKLRNLINTAMYGAA